MGHPTQPFAWGVAALGFATFAVGTCEFVLAGVLPELSRDVQVSVATAGQVVTVFALTCAVLAPVLATLTAARSRYTVLLAAVAVHLLGVVGTALAPGFGTVLAAQVVAAAGAGLFVPTAAVTAAALVPEGREGRAIAIVTTGFTAATALGAPLGTAVGSVSGWRATMWGDAGLAVLGLAGIALLVPRRVPGAAQPDTAMSGTAMSGTAMSGTAAGTGTGTGGGGVGVGAGLRQRLAPLKDRRVLAILTTTVLGFTAVYIPYTYIAVVFAPATDGSGDRLALLMFTLGVVGTLGNLGAGFLADRAGGRKVVGAGLLWLTVALALLPVLVRDFASGLAMIVVYGAAAFALTTPQQHRLITLDPGSAPVLVSLNAAALYLAISLSGAVGAAGLRWGSAALLPVMAAVLAVLALLASERAHRLTRAAGPSPGAHQAVHPHGVVGGGVGEAELLVEETRGAVRDQ